jgi:GNAT superfamily N-acetyltransferase
MPTVAIHSMAGRPDWVTSCAAWWHPQWGASMGYSLDSAHEAITGLTAPEGRQAALIGLVDDTPAGSVFLIDNDLDTHAHLRPWLAGLFVLPRYRGTGVGRQLIEATVGTAARIGYDQLYLYTSIPDFYRVQDWQTHDTLMLHDVLHHVMTRSTR